MMPIKHVGWVGTGVMGKSMCKHLANAGFQLSVYNRTKSKADELLTGSYRAKFREPLNMASDVDALVLMVGYPRDVRSLVLEDSGGILKMMKPGTLLIDHTTSEPSLAREIDEAAHKYGIQVVDAPVSGGDIGA